MAKNSSVNLDITNQTNGFDITGGGSRTTLAVYGTGITIVSSGANTYTFPATGGTIALLSDVSAGGTVYTTTFTGVQGVTGGGDFTANRTLGFYGVGVTITSSILTGNSIGSAWISGSSITNSFISGSTIGTARIVGSSISTTHIYGGTYLDATLSGTLKVPTGFQIGGVSMSSSSTELNLLIGSTKLTKIHITGVTPSAPATGELWINTA